MSLIGQSLDELDTPQAVLDLDVVDRNLARMFEGARQRGVAVRTHFKSLKCGGLARYIAARGGKSFLCAKLNEAETLADAGIGDILIANQVVGRHKMPRLSALARRVTLRICVDDAENVAELSRAMAAVGADLGVLVEVDIGMARCGVPPGSAVLDLARIVQQSPGLRFDGLQGYDGHLQQIRDPGERRAKCLEGLEKLSASRTLLEKAGCPLGIVTGAGTGTWEYFAGFEGVTEVQPGSFVLMDCAYHTLRPEFGCALSILATILSRRDGWYVLDAGSKAISQDFGTPIVKDCPQDTIVRLAEEHAKVESSRPVRVGERRQVIPAHCCATMNLHRSCVGVRNGRIEVLWPIEASGHYD